MLNHYRMLAAYNAWANQRLYEAAAFLTEAEFNENKGAFFGSVCNTLNHLLVADRIWLKRFTGAGEAPSSLNAILHADVTSLAAAREGEDRRIVEWVDGLDDKTLRGPITYSTVTNPASITQPLAPALAHFFNHQTHHRGQAHATLTALGKPSIVLDLIYFLRLPEGQAFVHP